MVKEVNVLGLPLSPERLFEMFESYRLVVVNRYEPAVCEDSP
jgi:hypothetical protein